MKQKTYDDIINLPHHVSVVHPHMSLYDRAAQFAPFKALTGYEDDISETARLTFERVELDEERIAQLDAQLRVLEEHLAEAPVVTVAFFCPDERKDGGSYEVVTGAVRKVDAVRRVLVLAECEVAIEDIYSIKGEVLKEE